jgi:epoxide hydrolase-like predicted phosphatase
MQITTIIWDIGGVLERTEDFHPRALLCERLGISVNDLSDLIFGNSTEFRVQLGLVSLEEHYDHIQEQLSLGSRDELNEVLEQFFAGDRLDTTLVDHIRLLRQEYTTLVLSNYMIVLRDKINNVWQIGDAFDHLIISAEVGVKKPSPEIYHIALETAGCRPEQAVFIDDDARNIQAAAHLELHTVHFQHREQALEELDTILKG